MASIDISLVPDLLAALFCGAFIGMEREHDRGVGDGSSADPPESRNLAGIRTHTLVALLGALSRRVDVDAGSTPWFTSLAFGAAALWATISHGVRAARTGRYGMTSVPTLLLTFALGVLCVSGERPVALALAVVITAVLAIKVPLHSFVRALTPVELAAAVKLGLVTLAMLPLLPDRDFGPADWPWLAEQLRGFGLSEAHVAALALLNPYKLWFLVVLISGLGFVGYVLVRVLGPGRGFLATGFAGGLVSSTSVTLAMAEQSRQTPQWRGAIASAVLGACAVMAARVLAVAVALHGRLFLPLGLPIASMMLSSLVVALILNRRGQTARTESRVAIATPLAIVPALKLAGVLLLVRVLSEVAVLAIGNAGLVLMAAISGLVDVDAITVAASQQAGASQVSDGIAAAAICTAVAVNTVTKGTLILVTGDRATGRTTFLSVLLTLAVGLAGLAVVWLAGFGFR